MFEILVTSVYLLNIFKIPHLFCYWFVACPKICMFSIGRWISQQMIRRFLKIESTIASVPYIVSPGFSQFLENLSTPRKSPLHRKYTIERLDCILWIARKSKVESEFGRLESRGEILTKPIKLKVVLWCFYCWLLPGNCWLGNQ